MNKRFLTIIAALSLTSPVLANQPKVEWYAPEATGCMVLRECTEDVQQVYSLLDVSTNYSNPGRFTAISGEFNTMLSYLNQIGIDVFLADEKYFGVGQRGLYHTKYNKFFLNKTYMHRPGTLMSVMRHEAWHVAQDCMAGTIDNSLIGIIKPEDEVPMLYQNMVEKTYPKSVWPWEKEASWAGRTEGMTLDALQACASDIPMWEIYEPTPLTRQYLEDYGFIQN